MCSFSIVILQKNLLYTCFLDSSKRFVGRGARGPLNEPLQDLVDWSSPKIQTPSVRQNLCEGRIITFHLLHPPGDLINLLEVMGIFWSGFNLDFICGDSCQEECRKQVSGVPSQCGLLTVPWTDSDRLTGKAVQNTKVRGTHSWSNVPMGQILRTSQD